MADSVASLLAEGRERLAAAPFEPSTREAALLLGFVLGLSEARVIARSDDAVVEEDAKRFRKLLARRLTGEPIAYIFGEKEFYGRPFRVDPRVLIPRPETEHLIEAALELDLPDGAWILDIGTGSGCIAVTLALELPGSRVVASDVSPAALTVAVANSRMHRVAERFHPLACDLAAALDLTRFDLVVGNPPYVDPAVRADLSIEITHFEPDSAVFAPGHGHSILERLSHELTGLRPGTPILLEIGSDQADPTARLARDYRLTLHEIRRDLADRPRIAVLAAPPEPAG